MRAQIRRQLTSVNIFDLNPSVVTTSISSSSLAPDDVSEVTFWPSVLAFTLDGLVLSFSNPVLDAPSFSACSKLAAAIGLDVICHIFLHVMSSSSTQRVRPLIMIGSF